MQNSHSDLIYKQDFNGSDVSVPSMPIDLGLNQHLKERISARHNSRDVLSAKVYRTENARLHGEWGYTIVDDNELTPQMRECGWADVHFIHWGEKGFDRPARDNIVTVPGSSINLLWPGILTYGHWLLDTIPRLFMLQRAGVAFHECTCLLPANSREYMRQIIKAFGVPNWVEVGQGTGVHCEQVFTPTSTRIPLVAPKTLNADAFAYFTEINKNINNYTQEKMVPPRLHVSHTPLTSAKHDMRILTNEEEVAGMLRTAQFETFDPLAWTFEEQFSGFSRATHFAGVDSSALHNAVFATPGMVRKIIVLCPPWRVNYNHVDVASYVGADLFMIKGHADAQEGNFVVDVEDLRRALEH